MNYYITLENEYGSMKSGCIHIGKEEAVFDVQVSENPCKTAINKEHIVKLTIFIKRKKHLLDPFKIYEIVAKYNHGWALLPKTDKEKTMLNAVLRYFKDPRNCRFYFGPLYLNFESYSAIKRMLRREVKSVNKEYRLCRKEWESLMRDEENREKAKR